MTRINPLLKAPIEELQQTAESNYSFHCTVSKVCKIVFFLLSGVVLSCTFSFLSLSLTSWILLSLAFGINYLIYRKNGELEEISENDYLQKTTLFKMPQCSSEEEFGKKYEIQPLPPNSSALMAYIEYLPSIYDSNQLNTFLTEMQNHLPQENIPQQFREIQQNNQRAEIAEEYFFPPVLRAALYLHILKNPSVLETDISQLGEYYPLDLANRQATVSQDPNCAFFIGKNGHSISYVKVLKAFQSCAFHKDKHHTDILALAQEFQQITTNSAS